MQKKTSLSERLLYGVLVISSALTFIFTVVNFIFDYKNETSSINDLIKQIETSTIDTTKEALYKLDRDLINNQLHGLMNIPQIIKVTLVDEKNAPVAQLEKAFEENKKNDFYDSLVRIFVAKANLIIARNYPLVWESSNHKDPLGVLSISFSKELMYRNIAQRAISFFMMQGLKTMLVSIILLIFFQLMVTIHLTSLTNAIAKNKDQLVPISIKRRNDKHDELSLLIESINKMIVTINAQKASFLMRLDMHKEKSLNSSKLAGLGEVTGGVAHEINNPLFVIRGVAHLLQKMVSAHPEGEVEKALRKSIQKIDMSVEKISDIILALLYLSKDSTREDIAPVNSQVLIDRVLVLCAERFRSHNIELLRETQQSMDLSCRSIQVSQVLFVLINNAFEAVDGRRGAWMKIATHQKENHFEISVTDSGAGLDEHVLNQIFTPFYTTKPVGKGTGLGLSLAREIVTAYGWDLYVEASSLNTCFVIKIPTKITQKESVA